jgi:prefoldin subunit 5
MAKTVDELLEEKNLTKEEMEALKDVIAECRERERRIEESIRALRRNLEMLVSTIDLLQRRSKSLLSSVENLRDSIETLYLLSLPKEKFYIE